MTHARTLAALAALLTASGAALAAGGDLGETAKQATNWIAIIMFTGFVAATLWITKWAAGRTKSAADFYTAGGGITGFQNGLAIAATTCRPRPSWAFRRPSWPPATTG